MPSTCSHLVAAPKAICYLLQNFIYNVLSGMEPRRSGVCGAAAVGHSRDRGRAKPQREQAGEEDAMRNGLWSIVVGGVAGALLCAGPVGAQPFPGGLPACQVSLNTCTRSLTQTQGQLSACTSNLSICTTSLGTCQTELAACLGEPPTAVFPGDGVDGPALSYTDTATARSRITTHYSCGR